MWSTLRWKRRGSEHRLSSGCNLLYMPPQRAWEGMKLPFCRHLVSGTKFVVIIWYCEAQEVRQIHRYVGHIPDTSIHRIRAAFPTSEVSPFLCELRASLPAKWYYSASSHAIAVSTPVLRRTTKKAQILSMTCRHTYMRAAAVAKEFLSR